MAVIKGQLGMGPAGADQGCVRTELLIKARGLKPKANYQIPIWTEEIDSEHRVSLEQIIDNAFRLAVEQEKSEQIYEENINSFVEAINAKQPVPQVYQRDDHLMRNSPEAKYAQEDTEQS